MDIAWETVKEECSQYYNKMRERGKWIFLKAKLREKLDNWKWLCCHFRPHLLFLGDPFYYTAKLLPSLLLHAPAENIKPYFLLPDKNLVYQYQSSCHACISIHFLSMHSAFLSNIFMHNMYRYVCICTTCICGHAQNVLFSFSMMLFLFLYPFLLFPCFLYSFASLLFIFRFPVKHHSPTLSLTKKNEQLQLSIPIWLLPTLST